jgi:hypothetical protein
MEGEHTARVARTPIALPVGGPRALRVSRACAGAGVWGNALAQAKETARALVVSWPCRCRRDADPRMEFRGARHSPTYRVDQAVLAANKVEPVSSQTDLSL